MEILECLSRIDADEGVSLVFQAFTIVEAQQHQEITLHISTLNSTC